MPKPITIAINNAMFHDIEAFSLKLLNAIIPMANNPRVICNQPFLLLSRNDSIIRSEPGVARWSFPWRALSSNLASAENMAASAPIRLGPSARKRRGSHNASTCQRDVGARIGATIPTKAAKKINIPKLCLRIRIGPHHDNRPQYMRVDSRESKILLNFSIDPKFSSEPGIYGFGRGCAVSAISVGMFTLAKRGDDMVLAGAAGFEPAIPGLGGRCIIHALLHARDSGGAYLP